MIMLFFKYNICWVMVNSDMTVYMVIISSVSITYVLLLYTVTGQYIC